MIENKEKNGGKAKVAEVAKAIGERWAKLSAEEKSKFEHQAKEAKEKHIAEQQAFKEANDPLAVLKEKYAGLIPKKPAGAYWIFAQDASERAKAEQVLKDAGEEATHKNITTKLGELWKSMNESEKVIWNNKAKQAVVEHEEKRKIWEATPEFVEFQRVEREQKEIIKEKKKQENAEQNEAAKEKTPSKRKAPKKDEGSLISAKKSKVEKPSRAGKDDKPQMPVIADAILKKAQSLGLEAALNNLASRSDIMAKELPPEELLVALQQNEGLVNKTRYAILGA